MVIAAAQVGTGRTDKIRRVKLERAKIVERSLQTQNVGEDCQREIEREANRR